MAINVRVEVKQYGDPQQNLKWALSRLRKYCGPVMAVVRAKEFYVSESRQRREKAKKAAFDRRVGR